MSENNCTNCANLQSQLAHARREIHTLRQQIRTLQQRIQLARQLCHTYIAATHHILSQPSGVPRGKWAYAKGAHRVAAQLTDAMDRAGIAAAQLQRLLSKLQPGDTIYPRQLCPLFVYRDVDYRGLATARDPRLVAALDIRTGSLIPYDPDSPDPIFDVKQGKPRRKP